MFAAILGFVGIAAGLDVIYRQEYVNFKNHQHKDKEKEVQENITNAKIIEKLDQELELLRIQNDKAHIELENLRNREKKSSFLDRIKNLIS